MSYVTIHEQYKLKHVQVPKVFFTNEKYKKLSNDAKIAYALLMDRHNLSLKNGWIEEGTGRIYFVFKQDEIMKLLNISSNSTWQKIKKELVAAGLLEFKRIGLKQPNRMYIKWPEVTDEDIYKIMIMESNQPEESASNPTAATEVQKVYFKKYKNCTSRNTKNVLQEVQKVYPNNTELSNTDLSNTELNNHHPLIEGFNQHQSNLIYEFLKAKGIDDDDDLKNKLLEKLKGKRFKYMAYIEKTFETIKNMVDPNDKKPIRKEIVPDWLNMDYSQPEDDDFDVEKARRELEERLKKYEDLNEKRAW